MKKPAPVSTSQASPPKRGRRPKTEAISAVGSPVRKKMPAEVFVKIWKGEMEGTEWEEWVTFGKDYYDTPQVKFSSITVEEEVWIVENEKPLIHVVLSNSELPNCVFMGAKIKSMTICNSKIEALLIMNNSETGSFQIRDKSAIGSVQINGNSATKNFSIDSKSETGNFLIEENSKTKHISIRGNSKSGDFFISNSVTGNFSIGENSTTGNFSVSGNSLTGDFSIGENSTTGSVSIVNSTFGYLLIWGEATIKEISIRNGSTIGSLILGNSIIGQFSIQNSKVTVLSVSEKSRLRKVVIWHSELQSIKVMSGSFVGHFKCQLNLQAPTHLLFEHSHFGYLDFDNSVFPEFTTLNVSSCVVNCLSLDNFCNYGTVFFSGLHALETWKDFKKDESEQFVFSEGKYQFEEVSSPSTLRLTDSDLGKMQFINCDLRQFQRFEFSNTKMLEVFVAGSQMPGNKAFCLPNDEKNPSKLAEQKRLAFGQFKKIYEARGDVAGALRYLSYEMRAYRAMLSDRVKRHQPFSKQWFDYVGELGILWLNQFSTNYGNNWLRGVVVTLILTVACFSFYCFLLGYRPQPIGGDWEKFGDLASHSLVYLNPFRDEDSGQFFDMLKEDGLKITWYARLWDYLSRIFIAYFVYQTIQAFRKLGKSSG